MWTTSLTRLPFLAGVVHRGQRQWPEAEGACVRDGAREHVVAGRGPRCQHSAPSSLQAHVTDIKTHTFGDGKDFYAVNPKARVLAAAECVRGRGQLAGWPRPLQHKAQPGAACRARRGQGSPAARPRGAGRGAGPWRGGPPLRPSGRRFRSLPPLTRFPSPPPGQRAGPGAGRRHAAERGHRDAVVDCGPGARGKQSRALPCGRVVARPSPRLGPVACSHPTPRARVPVAPDPPRRSRSRACCRRLARATATAPWPPCPGPPPSWCGAAPAANATPARMRRTKNARAPVVC